MNTVTWVNILTGITAILGAVFGTGGLVLRILNYLRDRSKIQVRLQWHMEIRDDSLQQLQGDCGLITVTNAGRRPVYISHACLILPKSFKNRLLLLKDSVSGRKLSEGDPPMSFIIPHNIQSNYAEDLKRIRAQVSDSTGQVYLSKYPRLQQTCRPSETG